MEGGGVIDHEDFGDMLRPAIEELAGRLDEHNFSGSMGTGLDESDLASDLPWTFKHTYLARADGVLNLLVDTDPGAAASFLAQIQAYPLASSWRRVGTAQDLNLSSPRTVRVVGGCQFWWGAKEGTLYATKPTTRGGTSWTNRFQTVWAIRVGGAVYSETMLGSQDWSEESPFHTERGYFGAFNAPYVDTMVPLPAGNHSIELVYCIVDDPYQAVAVSTEQVLVSNFELLSIVMER